jgi:hypothetical protein
MHLLGIMCIMCMWLSAADVSYNLGLFQCLHAVRIEPQ